MSNQPYAVMLSALTFPTCYLHGIGGDEEVCVVEQSDLWPLHQQQEGELDEQHEGKLPDAADLQEHRAGQQRQQHAVAKILRAASQRDVINNRSQKNTNANVTFQTVAK